MSSISSNHSAPPPYSTNPPPDLNRQQAAPAPLQQGIPQQHQQYAQPYQQVHQHAAFAPGFTPQQQPLFYPPQQVPIPVFHPHPPAVVIATSSYPIIPFGYQVPFPQPVDPAPIQTYHQSSGMAVIPAPTQAGFVPHPPAIIPGIPGVHQYPLFVSKEGEGPPPLPIFAGWSGDGYTGGQAGAGYVVQG